MASIDFRFTRESPQVQIGGINLRFEKLHITQGDISDINFHFTWEEDDPKNAGHTFFPFQNISLNSYVHPYQLASKTDFEFRDYEPAPIVSFDKHKGIVTITASSKSGQPFDVQAWVVIEYPK